MPTPLSCSLHQTVGVGIGGRKGRRLESRVRTALPERGTALFEREIRRHVAHRHLFACSHCPHRPHLNAAVAQRYLVRVGLT